MNLAPEHQKDFEAAPAALRKLIAAELAAGNSIEEVGHSHPAPPAGAYFKFAKKISTRPRASGDGLNFYERNSSIYSGEFTDAKRFYFVLEPPNPPPPEPDMDAIRKALEPKPDPLVQLAQRSVGSSVEIALGESSSFSKKPDTRGRGRSRSTEATPVTKALTSTETATGAKRLLHFRDQRPPHEVQFALERELMVLFTIVLATEGLQFRARADVIGANYEFELCFVAALPRDNCYSLRTEVSWADAPATHYDYYRKTSDSWFTAWTRDLMAANPPAADAGSPERYRKLAEAALKAEAHLDSVAAIQQAIVAGLKRGGRYATSHKEGGTNITWRLDRFIRSDYGDDPDLKEYPDETEFLKMLRQFCQWDVMRHAAKQELPEMDVWKLILRRMCSQ